MNVQLSNTEEYINQKPTGSLGQVLIRFVVFFFLTFLPPRDPSADKDTTGAIMSSGSQRRIKVRMEIPRWRAE